ncbi:E3 ubiquitin-protein ligase, putative [Plasmodium chabaudi adami]|uniref:E3 ubiquitin-protein ligase CHIP n=1 Tax=Plasmodium chabaudi adami TaxID=5826 RepID=A0A1D3RSX5_PLACE|nr:E3 ubiquitin-protein ligase, putative [Plasmodium chabaudi adami]
MDNNKEVKKKSFLKNWNINYLSNNFNNFIKNNIHNKSENKSGIKIGISNGTADNTSKNDYNLMDNNIHITDIREMNDININNIKNIRPDYYGKGYSTTEIGNNNTCINNHKYNNYNTNSNDIPINFIHTNDKEKTHMNYSGAYNKINFQNLHQTSISSNVENNIEDNKTSFIDMNSIKENSSSYNKCVYRNLHNCNNNNSDTMNTQYNIDYNKCTIDDKNNIKIENPKDNNNSNTENTNNNDQSRNKFDINNEYCMNKNRLINENNSGCKNNTINLNNQGNENNNISNNNGQSSFNNNRSCSVSSMVSSNSSIPSSVYSGQSSNYSQTDRINQKKHKISRNNGSNDNNVNKRSSSVSHTINNNSNDRAYYPHENSHLDWNSNENNNPLSEEQANKNVQKENYNIYRSELNKNISTYTSNDRNTPTCFTQNRITTNSSTNTSSETRPHSSECILNDNPNSGYRGHDGNRSNCKDDRYNINSNFVNTNTENKKPSIFSNDNNHNSNNNNKDDSEIFTDTRRGLNQYSQDIDTKYSRFSNNAYSENHNNHMRMSNDGQGNSGREGGGDDRYDRRDRYEKRGGRSYDNNGQGNGGDSDGGSGDNNGQGNREGDSEGDSDDGTSRKKSKNRRKQSSMDDEVETKNNNSLNLDMLNPEERKREAEKYKVLGNQSYKLGYFESAIDYYTKAIQYDNTNHVYFTNRALCYKKQKLWKLANIDARQALNLEEESVKAHFILGLTLLHLNSLEEGLKKLTKAKTLSSYLKDSNESEINRYILQAKKLIYLRDEQTKQLKYAELQSFFIEKINLLNQMGYITNEEKFLRTEQTEDLFKEVLGTFQKKQIPDYLCCKISMCLMNEPVITPSGVTYDKIFLYEHVKHNGSFDPVSREQFSIREVIPNYAIKEATDNFLKTNPWAFEE